MSLGVYKIKTTSGKFYYGTSQDMEKRFKQHMAALADGTHQNVFMQRVYNKHGASAFSVVFKHVPSIEEAFALEQRLIDKHWGTKPCMNLSKFARGGDNISYHPNVAALRKAKSATSRAMWAKMSAKERNRRRLAITGRNNPMWGRTHTAEARERIRKASTGRVGHNLGKRMSDETKRKLSEAAILRNALYGNTFAGKHHTEETKEKLRKMFTGKPNLACANVIMVGDLRFESQSAAAKHFNVWDGTIMYRLNSPNYPEYRRVEIKSQTTIESMRRAEVSRVGASASKRKGTRRSS